MVHEGGGDGGGGDGGGGGDDVRLHTGACEFHFHFPSSLGQVFLILGSHISQKNVTTAHFTRSSQSWWPDGQYTAPTDEALASDIQVVPMFGLNMIRCGGGGERRGWCCGEGEEEEGLVLRGVQSFHRETLASKSRPVGCTRR